MPKGDTATQQQGGRFVSWPVDDDGKPMALVSSGASEKIGLPNYSNVDIGPASVTRYVEDSPEAIQEGLKECTQLCEVIIANEREKVLEIIQAVESS